MSEPTDSKIAEIELIRRDDLCNGRNNIIYGDFLDDLLTAYRAKDAELTEAKAELKQTQQWLLNERGLSADVGEQLIDSQADLTEAREQIARNVLCNGYFQLRYF